VTDGGSADSPGGPDANRGLSKRARGTILVVVLGGLMLVGVLVGQRRRDDYDHTMTRVQVAAQAAGDTIDIGAFQSAWAQEQVGEGSGDEARPAAALVPKLAGADVASYTFTGGPSVVVDYQIDAGGQQGCVRMVRTPDGTTVQRADSVCARAFLGAP